MNDDILTRQPNPHAPPGEILPLWRAREVVETLQTNEADGWTYHLNHVGPRHASIMVYDEASRFMGWL